MLCRGTSSTAALIIKFSVKQFQKTQDFCVADFATQSDERRSRSKIFPLFVWIKEPCVRKSERLERSKLLGISQTKKCDAYLKVALNRSFNGELAHLGPARQMVARKFSSSNINTSQRLSTHTFYIFMLISIFLGFAQSNSVNNGGMVQFITEDGILWS